MIPLAQIQDIVEREHIYRRALGKHNLTSLCMQCPAVNRRLTN